MSAEPEHYSMMDVLGRGYELHITINRREFTLVQDRGIVVASVDGEQCRFIGCTDDEIKHELATWEPGTWKGK